MSRSVKNVHSGVVDYDIHSSFIGIGIIQPMCLWRQKKALVIRKRSLISIVKKGWEWKKKASLNKSKDILFSVKYEIISDM